MAQDKTGQEAKTKLWWAEMADAMQYHRAGKKLARALFVFRSAFEAGTIEAALKGGPLTVMEITQKSGGRSQPEVSTRLKNLHGFGLLKRQSVGRLVLYEINEKAFAKFTHLGQWLAIEAGGKRDARQYAYAVAHAFADSLTALVLEQCAALNGPAIEKEIAEKFGAKRAEIKYSLEKLAALGLVEKMEGEAGKESPDPAKPRGAYWQLTANGWQVIGAFEKGCWAIETGAAVE